MGAEGREVVVPAAAPAESPRAGTDLVSVGADRILQRRDSIRAVVAGVMRDGVHYGSIPGTGERVTLFKEGAEVLLSTFQIAIEPLVTDLSAGAEVKFKVEVRALHQVSGAYLGSGIGVCSSNEEKYRWRSPRSDLEYDKTPDDQKRVRFDRYESRKQVRCSPYDSYQTILAMAKKRAIVDCARTVLAASEVLKEIGDERARARQGQRRPPPAPAATPGRAEPAPVQGRSAAPDPRPVVPHASPQKPPAAAPAPPAAAAPASLFISSIQAMALCDKLDAEGIPESEILAHFEIGRMEELELAKFEECRALIDRMAP